ncbi:hypothetical protein [Sneathiella glossodoripedis]|uniref:hypothetical protein n=1 Tax=Sneathiella glossodoripedis TaxID=418853 RepID=UPI00131F1F28|nr:hypothetical protein [Sneathiella glossodoripedis]
MNKEYSSQLIFSDRIAREAGFKGNTERQEVIIRGRNRPLQVHIVKDATTLDI